MVIRGFRKCGISLPTDGSENNISIKGIENYQVDSDDDNPFNLKVKMIPLRMRVT